jgi:hypothetical protein
MDPDDPVAAYMSEIGSVDRLEDEPSLAFSHVKIRL